MSLRIIEDDGPRTPSATGPRTLYVVSGEGESLRVHSASLSLAAARKSLAEVRRNWPAYRDCNYYECLKKLRASQYGCDNCPHLKQHTAAPDSLFATEPRAVHAGNAAATPTESDGSRD